MALGGGAATLPASVVLCLQPGQFGILRSGLWMEEAPGDTAPMPLDSGGLSMSPRLEIRRESGKVNGTQDGKEAYVKVGVQRSSPVSC